MLCYWLVQMIMIFLASYFLVTAIFIYTLIFIIIYLIAMDYACTSEHLIAYSYLDCEFVILYLFVAEMFNVYFGHKKWKFVICNSGVHNNICCGECTDHFMFVGVWCAKSTVSRRRFICLTYLTPFCLWPNLVGLCNVHMDRCNMVTSGKQE